MHKVFSVLVNFHMFVALIKVKPSKILSSAIINCNRPKIPVGLT